MYRLFTTDRESLYGNSNAQGNADIRFYFGNPRDKPFVGDFDGDGIETVGLHRESTGLVYFRNVHATGNTNNEFIFGNPGDRIVAGDWANDGISTPALFRPSNTTVYRKYSNSPDNADDSYAFGQSTRIPVTGAIEGVVATLASPHRRSRPDCRCHCP